MAQGANTYNPLAPTGGGFTSSSSAPGGLYGTGPGGANPYAGASPYNPGGGQATPFQGALPAYLQYNSPTLQQYQNNAAQGYQNLAYNQGIYGINQSDLQNQYASNMGDISTQIDVNGLQAARSRADAAAYAQMMGYNTDVFNAQAAGLGNTATANLRNINSQATANGAYTATGVTANRNSNYDDFMDQYKALAGNYQQQQTQLQMRQGNAETQAQILDREASNLGMKAGQLQTTLNNGLAKLGLQNQISVGNLLTGIQNNNLQALQLYYSIIQQAGQYATAAGQG